MNNVQIAGALVLRAEPVAGGCLAPGQAIRVTHYISRCACAFGERASEMLFEAASPARQRNG